MVADIEELEPMDASEIYSERLNAKEVIFSKKWKIHFPVADGRIKFVGGGTENIHLDTEGSLPPPHDSFPDAGEGINDFRFMSGKLHIPPSR